MTFCSAKFIASETYSWFDNDGGPFVIMTVGGVRSASNVCTNVATFPASSVAVIIDLYLPSLRLNPLQLAPEQLTEDAVEFTSRLHSHIAFLLLSHEKDILPLLNVKCDDWWSDI